MKKFLDIFILSLLIVLTINLFFGSSEPKTPELDGRIVMDTTQKSYTIPASVGLSISNYSTGSLMVNTCNDLVLNHAGKNISIPETACSEVTIESGKSQTIDFVDSYNLFTDAGQYNFEYNKNDQRHLVAFDIEHRGSFSKLFSAIFYAPIYNLVVFLITLFNNSLGWAIIAVTIIVRIILLWPQHKMMVSQKKLQAIQPKIKKIQEENKGNQQAIGMKLMELYKKEQVNPMGSCGFLLIQMPILLVIYNIILSIKDPSNSFHLYAFQSDFLIANLDYNFFGIDLLAAGGLTGIVLALVVAAIQFIQVKLSLAGKSTDKKNIVLEKKKDDSGYNSMMPDPDMMNKFMLYGMPAMVAVFTYTLIAGVGIYWGMSTLFMIGQQLVVNKILKK